MLPPLLCQDGKAKSDNTFLTVVSRPPLTETEKGAKMIPVTLALLTLSANVYYCRVLNGSE